MYFTKSNHQASEKTSLMLFLFATALGIIMHQQYVSCEPDSPGTSGSSDQGQSSEFGNPKRQYLIAPRIGRSDSGSQALWSALEEAALTMPGSMQNQRFSIPSRSSLLFLLGNRRMIGQRSGGLLPQARLGRRSAPIGLFPQPRVGRRSVIEPMAERSSEDADSQQEVALATLSDSSPVNDILDSLMAP